MDELRSGYDPECAVREEETHGEGVADYPFTDCGDDLHHAAEEDHDCAGGC